MNGIRNTATLLLLGWLVWQTAVGCQAFDTPIRIQRCPSGEVQQLAVHVVKNNNVVRGLCTTSVDGNPPRFTLETPCDVSTNFTLPILGEGEQLLFVFDRTQGKASYCETCAEGTQTNQKGQCSLQGPPPCQAQEICNNQEDDDCDGQVDEGCSSIREPVTDGPSEPRQEVVADAQQEANLSDEVPVDGGEPTSDKKESFFPDDAEALGSEGKDGGETVEPDGGAESIADASPDSSTPENSNSQEGSTLADLGFPFEQKNDPNADRVLERPLFGDLGSIKPEQVSNDTMLNTCTQTSQCPLNQFCSNGVCRLCSPGQKDCNSPQTCGSKWPMGCNSGFVCVLSECYPACTTHADCTSKQRCSVADSHSNRGCVTSCDQAKGVSNNPDCPASYFCTKAPGNPQPFCFHIQIP
ncbi:MAG: hypothetical protein EP343_26125 [Deltaproteobacteria bacterium]|nr:MAG: hypothetical protein EP343_26125 [Deltaproteobacteria bacterium]